MNDYSYLDKVGVFCKKDFLDVESCDLLKAQMVHSDVSKATVYEDGHNHLVERIRRTDYVISMPDETKEKIKEALSQLAPELESFFQVKLSACQEPTFLVYKKGDYFKAHKDNASTDADFPTRISARQVSIVLFLNSEVKRLEEGQFCGGILNLFQLVPNPDRSNLRTPIHAEKGLLVAFPSGVLHEVSPVKAGLRCNIVSWFV